MSGYVDCHCHISAKEFDQVHFKKRVLKHHNIKTLTYVMRP